MKKFIIKIIMFSLPVFILLVLTNYYFDPANIYHHGVEDRITEIIKSGKYATNFNNIDERSLVSKIPKSLNKAPDILVLGSSRTNYIRQEYYDNKSLINASVTGACLKDIIINYQLFKANNKLPKEKIIIGVDPWLFNNNNPEFRWERYESVFQDFVDSKTNNTEQLGANPISYYYQLVSLSYFQNALKAATINGSKVIPTEQKNNKARTILTDYSQVAHKLAREANKATTKRKVDDYFLIHGIRISNFDEISIELTTLFEKLIKDIKENKIDVEILIIPYHPQVYKIVQEKYPNIIQTEKIIYDFANENNVFVYGSFNPGTIDFDESDFRDGLHFTEDGMKNLIEESIEARNRIEK